MVPANIRQFIEKAIEEDLGTGDITSELLIPSERKATAMVVAKCDAVLAGMPFALEAFDIIDKDIKTNVFASEGAKVRKGDIIAEINGPARSILAGERVFLNILQRLSGVATLTNKFVMAVRGTKTKILDTRKTQPCMRAMEKYAVSMGGGRNHRFGLYDAILIKDNHIEAVGSIKEAVKRAKGGRHLSKIEVEVENLKEFREALKAGADVVMLDNMPVSEMKKAVELREGNVLLEASGNVTLENVREIAETGVDFISIGALTHSAPSADISLKIINRKKA